MDRSSRWSRTRPSVLAAVCLCLVLGAGPGGAAAAAPARKPSVEEIERARAAEASQEALIAQIESRLASDARRLEDAHVLAAAAAEAYNGAAVDLERRRGAAVRAREASARAAREYQRARKAVAVFSAEVYKDGGSFGSMGAFLGGDGPADAMARASAVDALGAQKKDAVARLGAARTLARLSRRQADQAVADQEAATRALQGARAAAEAAETSAARILADTRARRTRDVEELARLEAVTVSLVERRQQALAAERQAAAEAAAKAARERRERLERERAEREQDDQGSGSGSGSGSGGGTGTGSGGDTSTSSAGRTAVAWALRQVGKPYRWAADGPEAYDCSGLTMRAWERAGVSLAHYSVAQYDQTRRVSYTSMRAGDLIFYARDTSRPSTIHHVTMYIGGGRMVEAPYTGADVRVVPVRWSGAMGTAGRP